ncbi:MAG TPA: NAD-dependent epimerase/dehydratase family protein [Micromonosporaceae bacterium]|nr:NAD-dependent epimerase/dehydratase family protein [Micromonosporaceae bacterium]
MIFRRLREMGNAMIVVTGGAGYIGSNLALALLRAGEQVRIVDLRDPVTAREAGATWVRADVRDAAATRNALDGAEVVYHLAGVISVVGPLGGLVESVNVDGARVVAETALAAGARRLVHCSSIHAYDVEKCVGEAVNEESPRAVRQTLPAYDRSKAGGEAEVRRVVDRGLDAVVVNPSAVIGPIDEGPSRVGQVMRALWRRRLPALVDGGFDWVDVADVVAGLRAAAERGRTGENYLLSGHRRSFRELAEIASACAGAPVTRRTAPMWLARAGAPLCTVIARRTGTALLPTREALDAVRSFPTVDRRKAERELGYTPRPIETTLSALYAYFRDRGDLGRRRLRS